MSKQILVAALIVVATSVLSENSDKPHIAVSMVEDWSSRHVVFREGTPLAQSPEVLQEPRYWGQYLRRHLPAALAQRAPVEEADREAIASAATPQPTPQRDWSVSLGNGNGGTISAPAKYVFDVTLPANCLRDFVVTGINTAGSATQANIIGLDNLYVNAAGTGFCPGKNPSVIFAYNIGPGTIPSYVALSLDGKKIAFNENSTGTSYFHVLTFKKGAGNGGSATSPVVPGVGNTAVDTKIALSSGVTTAPFIDFRRDIAYVTTSDSKVHKFTGVFNGTPTEVRTGGWPVTIAGNPGISSPVYEAVSKKVFFTDGTGRIVAVNDGVTPPTVSTVTFASTGITAAPVIVDSTLQKVYAFNSNPNGGNAVAVQVNTNFAAASLISVNIGDNSTNNVLEGTFNNAYYSGGPSGSASLYVVGNDASNRHRPALYNIGFTTSFSLRPSPGNGPLTLISGNTNNVTASPLSEFYNANLAKDFLFVSVSDSCTNGVGGKPTAGCIRSLDITGGFPPNTSINNVVLSAPGGTGIITVDNNDITHVGASSIYYTTLGGNTLVKATQAGLQ